MRAGHAHLLVQGRGQERSLTDTGPGERQVWGRVTGSRCRTPWATQGDKAQLAEGPALQRVGRSWPFLAFYRGPGRCLKYLSLAQLETVIPPRGWGLGTAVVSRGKTVQYVTDFTAANIFFLSFMKEFPVNPPPVMMWAESLLHRGTA